jgi:hypothetical protein
MMVPGINRAGKKNEGVGEHVRVRSHLGRKPASGIADHGDPHRMKNAGTAVPGSSAGPFLERANSFESGDPAV